MLLDFDFPTSYPDPQHTVQFSHSVMSGSLRPMNRSTPGLPVHHQLPEFSQTHVHRVGDGHPAISSSVVPFSSCPQSLPASESFPMSQLIRWPKYWSFSLSISPSKEHPGLISFRMHWLDLLAVQGTLCFGAQLSSQSNSHIHT